MIPQRLPHTKPAQGTSSPLVEIVGEYRYVETGQKIRNVVITVDVGDRPLPMISILLINCRRRSWLKQRSAAEVHGRYGRSFEPDWTDERSPALPTLQLFEAQVPRSTAMRLREVTSGVCMVGFL
jgi:hypothetical protein